MNFYSIHILVTLLLRTFLKFAEEINAKMTEHECPMGLVFSRHVNEVTFRTILREGGKMMIVIVLIVMKVVCSNAEEEADDDDNTTMVMMRMDNKKSRKRG